MFMIMINDNVYIIFKNKKVFFIVYCYYLVNLYLNYSYLWLQILIIAFTC